MADPIKAPAKASPSAHPDVGIGTGSQLPGLETGKGSIDGSKPGPVTPPSTTGAPQPGVNLPGSLDTGMFIPPTG
jgi:hypothetical protein